MIIEYIFITMKILTSNKQIFSKDKILLNLPLMNKQLKNDKRKTIKILIILYCFFESDRTEDGCQNDQ